ncbi:hypothetical protein EV198_3489 [Roseivirga ehrenbergii]|nr:hypothetical protein EV198_3489 [Roseivirga ehrenbergii]|tara:strand:- start:58294 stop:58557 length:264 start_codon:yes stop_codon:yes gene_type:complete
MDKTLVPTSGYANDPKFLRNMYIIKVKGKAKIPDYIQLRDENFVLIAYFRADRPLKKLEKYDLEGKETELQEVINNLPFGKLQKLDI